MKALSHIANVEEVAVDVATFNEGEMRAFMYGVSGRENAVVDIIAYNISFSVKGQYSAVRSTFGGFM